MTGSGSVARLQVPRTNAEQTALLEAVFDGSVSCLVVMDRAFNFIRVNQAYAAACGRHVDEFPGRNHFDMFPSDARLIFEAVVRSKQPFRVDARPFEFPDDPARGTTYWDWTLTPVLDAIGDVVYLILSLNDVTERKRAEARLLESEARLRELATGLLAQLESERAHIARELHDELGQELTLVKCDLLRVTDGLTAEPLAIGLRERIDGIGQAIDRACNSVRRLTTWLRPAVLDAFGLAEAIAAEAPGIAARGGTRCTVRHDDNIHTLDRDQETAAFRIVQEALNNVVRHAAATLTVVSLRQTPRAVVIQVLDNGKGIPLEVVHARDSLGLVGMRERATLAGGTLEIRPRRRKGTAVTVTLPARAPRPSVDDD
jgi:PAS domain S-box-containing protein